MNGRVVLIAIATLMPLPGDAIVIRHDRDDAAFLDLADNYPLHGDLQDSDPAGLSGMGTLIEPQWVLTAAHVAAALSTRSIAEIAAREYPLERIVLHPKWHSDADLQADIALIRLAQPVDGSRRSACTPAQMR